MVLSRLRRRERMCSASERRGVVAARVDVGIAIGSNTSTALVVSLFVA